MCLENLLKVGYNPTKRKKGEQIYITDSGNEIIDLQLNKIEDSIKLENEIKLLPGVVEVGLFNNIADISYNRKRKLNGNN